MKSLVTGFSTFDVDTDPGVLNPLGYLKKTGRNGEFGVLTPEFINFTGYQPDVISVADRMIPQIIDFCISRLAIDNQAIYPS